MPRTSITVAIPIFKTGLCINWCVRPWTLSVSGRCHWCAFSPSVIFKSSRDIMISSLDRMVEFRRCSEIFNFVHKWHRIELLQILEHSVSRNMRKSWNINQWLEILLLHLNFWGCLASTFESALTCFSKNLFHTTLWLLRRCRAGSRNEQSETASQYCNTLHWSGLCLDYFSSWIFHSPADLSPGISDVLNSRNLPPFVKHEDPTCHHNWLHILDTTCFLLRVPRMPSVHR